jgi:hypothetical protein
LGDLPGKVVLTHEVLEIKLFYLLTLAYSILKRSFKTERKWMLDPGRFIYFRLCIREAAMEELPASGA